MSMITMSPRRFLSFAAVRKVEVAHSPLAGWFVRAALAAWLAVALADAASAQSFRVQCPSSTITHPVAANNNAEPAYTGPTTLKAGANGYLAPVAGVNGAIKCQQISGGDGYATMADGTQTYMFSFGPLSGLADMAAGKPGTQFPNVFNTVYAGTLQPGDPATAFAASTPFTYNGAVGLIADQAAGAPETAAATATLGSGGSVTGAAITSGGFGYTAAPAVTITDGSGFGTGATATATVVNGAVTAIAIGAKGSNYTLPLIAVDPPPQTNPCTNGATSPNCLTGHVDPRQIMDVGVMNGNIPAPLMAIDEDDEYFLTLSNVGMIMRPDLFEQHTVHFHGYPNAASIFDGVPDASVAINIGGSFTYYYLAPDAGTYFWHCHTTPPEHLQMGMVGQLYVRPRQNRVPSTSTLYAALQAQQTDLRTACNSSSDILCSNPLPAVKTAVTGGFANGQATQMYVYNDGDGSTAYDVEYPIQIHGFDPDFHFVGMTFNPEPFVDMKDKYFLLNGRSYPDTVTPGAMQTQSSDGRSHYSQPMPSIVNIVAGQKALLRISDLDVSEYQTLASLGIPMHVVGYNAKLLRDQAGNNMDYFTNSITLAGGESLDVILDTSKPKPDGTAYRKGDVYYLYTPQLDHLSNDAENFGGLMTEVHIN